MTHTKLDSRPDSCTSHSPRLHRPANIRASAIWMALLGSFTAIPAFAQCVNGYAPFPGSQSVSWVVTDVSSGMQLRNGSVVPASTGQIHFHNTGTADGHCDAYTQSCSTYLSTDYRGVNHLTTTMTTDASGFNPGQQYILGSTYFSPSNYSTSTPTHQILDDASSGTTGPIPNLSVFNPGTYNLTLASAIYPSFCPTMATPNSVSTTMTVSYHAPTGDKNLGCNKGGSDGQAQVGDPCDVSTGNAYQRDTDYQSSTLPLVRHYNSLLNLNVGLGVGWTTAYHRHLELFSNSLRVRRADGHSEPFTLTGGLWQGDPDTALSVSQDGTGFTVTVENGDDRAASSELVCC